MQHNSSGLLIADVVSAVISLVSMVLAFFGHLTVSLQNVAYAVSISAGAFTILFGFLNYRLNRRKYESEIRPMKNKSRRK